MTDEAQTVEPPEVFDAGDAAWLLHVDLDELQRLSARGGLRAVPDSSPLRIRRQEFEAFLTGQCRRRGELSHRHRRPGR